MRIHAFLLVAAPLWCFAQVPGAGTAPVAVQSPAGPKAPPEVDQALRARANAFLDYESKGNNRKAFDLVAEDSKDYYFEAKKEKSISFTIDEVQYAADLSTATVRSTMKRQTMLAGRMIEVPQVQFSQWKLEKGEWVWYHDPSKDVTATIIGPLSAAPVDGATESVLPKDLSEKAAAAAASKIIAPRATIDKESVSFILGKETTEQVTFHNSNNGPVRVLAEVRGVADTITVEPRDMMVNPQADVPYKITYKPRPESARQGAVLFMLEPFGSIYVLPVRLGREGQTRKGPAPVVPVPPAPAPAVP
jgi:hypothetical protein